MKGLMGGCLALLLATPALGQDETPPADVAADAAAPAETAAPVEGAAPAEAAEPVAEAAPAEAVAPVADAAPVEEAAPAEEAAAVEEAAPAEDTSASDSSSSESSERADSGEGLKLYVGVEYDQTTIDINDGATSAALGRRRFDSDFYKLRLGLRLLEGVGFELQGGIPDNKGGAKKLETSQFYGAYFVPTGVFMETIEISARLGYAFTTLKNELGEEDLDGVSFGLSFELPFRRFAEGLPDIRLSAGGSVYQEDRDARVYGYHAGLRYDFQL